MTPAHRTTPSTSPPDTAAGGGASRLQWRWKRGEFWACCGVYAPDADQRVEINWRGTTRYFGRRSVDGVVSEHWGVYNNQRICPSHPFCVVHLRSGCAAGYFKRQKDAKAFAEFLHAAHPEYATTGTWGALGMKALCKRSGPTAHEGYGRFDGYTRDRE